MKFSIIVNVLAFSLLVISNASVARPIPCITEPRSTTTLASAVEGLVAEVFVQRGDKVSVGEVLLRLEDDLERLQLELSRTRAQSDVNVRAETARQKLRTKEYERIKKLRDRNISAETVLEDAEIELALTELALEEARMNQSLAAIELRQAETLVEKRKIKSPVTGIVLSVDIETGEFANEQNSLLTIVVVESLYVEVFAPPDYFGKIAPGQEFPVRLKPPLDIRFSALVTTVDELLDAASGTFGVRLEVENSDGNIPAGARCEVSFDGEGF